MRNIEESLTLPWWFKSTKYNFRNREDSHGYAGSLSTLDLYDSSVVTYIWAFCSKKITKNLICDKCKNVLCEEGEEDINKKYGIDSQKIF